MVGAYCFAFPSDLTYFRGLSPWVIGYGHFAVPSDLTYFRGLSPWVIGYGHFSVPSDLTYLVRILEIYRVYFAKWGFFGEFVESQI